MLTFVVIVDDGGLLEDRQEQYLAPLLSNKVAGTGEEEKLGKAAVGKELSLHVVSSGGEEEEAGAGLGIVGIPGIGGDLSALVSEVHYSFSNFNYYLL